MRGTSAFLCAKNRFKCMYPMKGSRGTVATSAPKKQRSNEEGCQIENEKTDPIVAFSKPPPLPPVIGPLLALSLLDTLSDRDSNDD